MRINEQKAWIYFNKMTNEEKDKFLKRWSTINLAIKINPDIILETMDNFQEEYPWLKECLE